MRRSIARINVSMIRSDGPVGQFGRAVGSPAVPCCISDFDVFQHSLEDSREFHIHVLITALLGKFLGQSIARSFFRRVALHYGML